MQHARVGPRDRTPARAPAEHVTAAPMVVVLVDATTLLAAGIEGYARRDIG